MGRTACTEPQCLYKGAFYLYLHSIVCFKLHDGGYRSTFSSCTKHSTHNPPHSRHNKNQILHHAGRSVTRCGFLLSRICYFVSVSPFNQNQFLRHFRFLQWCRCVLNSSETYRGADKSLARPGRKQATATKLLQATQKKFRRLSVQPGVCRSNDQLVGRKWRAFNCFYSRVGLRTYQHLCNAALLSEWFLMLGMVMMPSSSKWWKTLTQWHSITSLKTWGPKRILV